jgi:hypothetical protein
MEAVEYNICEIVFSSISRAFLGSNSVMKIHGYAGTKVGVGLGVKINARVWRKASAF